MSDAAQPFAADRGRSWTSALLPGERIVWTGQPRGGVRVQASDAAMIPFSLLWGGFAIFWNVQVWRDGAGVFFQLWGLPFLAVGLWMIAGRFFTDAWWRARTFYALTDRRVLIRSPFRSVQSLDCANLPWLQLEQHRDGTGTLWFEPRTPTLGRRGSISSATNRAMRFDHIPDATRVYEQLSPSR